MISGSVGIYIASGLCVVGGGSIISGNSFVVCSGQYLGMSVSGNIWSGISGTVAISSGAVFTSNSWGDEQPIEPTIEVDKRIIDETPQEIGDYERAKITSIDEALNQAKQYRDSGHWTELRKVDENTVAVYISKWTKDLEIELGIPKFNGKIVMNKKDSILGKDEQYEFSDNGFDVELKRFSVLLNLRRLNPRFIDYEIQKSRLIKKLPIAKEFYTDLLAMNSDYGSTDNAKSIMREYEELIDAVEKIEKAKNI